jgi:hypothetical protein
VTSAALSQTPTDIARRIQELAQAPAEHVSGQHVVSKVLLRRFTATAGQEAGLLYPFRLRYPEARHQLLGPDGCGKVPDFIAYASGSAERLWKEVEDRLHDALAALDTGTLSSSAAHQGAIKDAIALHYARSTAARVVHYRTFLSVYAASRALWMTDWRAALEAAFYQTKGYYATGNQALGRFLDDIMQPTLDMAATGQLFRVRIEDIYQKAREWITSSALEILTPGSSEFLIGDVPALTIPRGPGRPGVAAGTALGDARTVIMPLGPRHLAALSRTGLTAELTREQVAIANAYQVGGAAEYVWLRPGSGLENFVNSLLR